MIPFTQYMRPDGRKVNNGVDMPYEIEELANQFINQGGKFECEVLINGTVSLTAVKKIDDEYQDVAIELSENGPGIKQHVEALVRRALGYV
jgi:hypothetical protein